MMNVSDLVQRTNNALHPVDYAVFFVFLAISIGIGIYFAFAGDRQRTAKEYLTGNRSLALVPVAISILVSFTSAILILGAPAEVYLNGTMYLYYTFGKIIAIFLASVIFVPLFYPLKLTSSFEYLEARFESKAVRILGNGLYMLSSILYMGIAMFAPSSALEFCSNGLFPVYVSIAASGVIATTYTLLGGIKAVVWTDVFQAGVMLVGVFAIIVKGTIDVGGPARVWELNDQYGRIQFDEVNPDPTVRHTVWGLVIGGAVGWLGTYGVNQASVQRYCSLPTIAKARQSLYINIPGALILTWTASAAGMVIFAYYQSISCDIHDAGWATQKNDIVPYYVMDQLHSYYTLPGLFIASLFSGALSSVSSSLNACAAITWKDILEPHFFKDVSESKAALINKVLTFIFGILGTGFGFVAVGLGGTVLQASLSFTGAAGAPSLGLFLMGAMLPFVNKYGAFSGALLGLIINMWLSIGSYTAGNQEVSLPGNISMCDLGPNFTISAVPNTTEVTGLQKFYQLSYLWYTLFGALISIIVGVLVSLVTNLIYGYKPPNHRYVLPFVRRFCCCCPPGCQEAFSCGVDLEARQQFEEEAEKENAAMDVQLGASNKVWPAEEPEPSAEEAEPSAEEAEPSAEGAAPSAEEAEPSAEGAAPSAEEAEPSAEEAEPSAGEAEPSAEEAEPSAEEAEPSAEEAEPSAEEAEPSAEEAEPSESQRPQSQTIAQFEIAEPEKPEPQSPRDATRPLAV